MKSYLSLHHHHDPVKVVVKGKLCIHRNGATIMAALFLLVCSPSAGTAAVNDSTGVDDKSCRFRPSQLIVPSVLITVGSIGVCNGWFHSINNDIKDGMNGWRKNAYVKIDDYLQYLPAAANVGLGLTGIKAKHPLKERIAVTATAYIAMGIMVNVTKRAVGEKRPDSDARNSFPSGHTATAFMGAELVRKEYGCTAGVCAYTLAAGVAVMRLYNNRHWLNDVFAGAGMGILSAKIGFWLLPWERRLFGWDGKKGDTALIPQIDAGNGSFAMTLYTCF